MLLLLLLLLLALELEGSTWWKILESVRCACFFFFFLLVLLNNQHHSSTTLLAETWDRGCWNGAADDDWRPWSRTENNVRPCWRAAAIVLCSAISQSASQPDRLPSKFPLLRDWICADFRAFDLQKIELSMSVAFCWWWSAKGDSIFYGLIDFTLSYRKELLMRFFSGWLVLCARYGIPSNADSAPFTLYSCIERRIESRINLSCLFQTVCLLPLSREDELYWLSSVTHKGIFSWF